MSLQRVDYGPAAVTERLEQVRSLQRQRMPAVRLTSYAPAEVERRLAQVSELRRLCLHLASAGRAAGL